MGKDLAIREKKTEAIAVSEKNEAETVAREMAAAYASAVEYYRNHYNLTPDEADKKASTTAGSPRRLQTAPADKISWLDLANTTEMISSSGSGVWERLKRKRAMS